MRLASTETYIAWAVGLLLLGAGLSGLGGYLIWRRSRQLRYFTLRRLGARRGWRLLIMCAALLVMSVVMFALGKPGVEVIVPPTPRPTASATPTFTPSRTPSPTISLTPSRTPTPSDTRPPTDTPTPTLSPTPALPLSFITPPGTVSVTPPAAAVAASLRFSLRDNCAVQSSLGFIDQVPKTIYAHFDYDNWLQGVQWSGVWYRDGELIFVETHLWDGSTGGCGFTNYDNGKLWWPEGAYEVQIFIGDRWLVSGQFRVMASTPTPTQPPTRTPRAPTPTRTP